ncbi:sugar ABC transporter permease [Sporanaerobium hydrogeniformans]|uniref:Sugar ABC transporter permease n=1 Tax=Sporanaerobium hydrogeniformans TaxID=3072179 RepID=A0AC61DEY4_9FIRM|nr:sugar ABC transporter permease [Sporanaerobium hydrogeniformans]PHV71839.1 sugar ABC transporter permease [Sporanaerobium hydrogeniformans]
MKKKKYNWEPYVFIAPNFIGFIIFIVLPVLFSLVISFTDFNIFNGFKGTSFVGLQNFIEMLKDEWFWAALKNNVIYTVVTIPVTMILSIVVATILNKAVYCKTLIRVMIFVPYIASVVAISVVWSMLFNPSQGIINQILMVLGVNNPPQWLGSMQWALPAIMIVGIWMTLGYNVIIYMSGLQSIPSSLYEAAQIDGASKLQEFRYITVPMLRNTTFFLLVTSIIASFQVFGTVNIMTNGGPGNSTTVLAHYIYVAGFRYYKMGYAASMAWFLLIAILIVTLLQWKVQKKHESNF